MKYRETFKAWMAASLCYLGMLPVLNAQTNIAPSAIVTASAATGTACYNCPQANDLNLGTCGTQQMFVWTSSPPSTTIGVDWIQWEWATPQSFDEMIIHHAQTTGRYMTGATMQAWQGGTWVTTGTFSGLNQANCINSVSFPVVVTNKFRITRLLPGTGQLSNLNFREFEIIEAILVDDNAAVASLDSPAGGCEGTYNIVATIANRGLNQIDSVRVNWSLNGVVQQTYHHTSLLDTITGPLPSMAQVNLGSHTFVGGQTDDIKIWTSMPNGVVDTFNLDDTVSVSWFNLPTIATFPYYEDFEASQGDWDFVGTSPSWAYGTPSKANISGAASGTKAIVTGLTSPYNANENSQANSPCFDFTGFTGTPWVALDANWYAEGGWDGAVLQASTDGGRNWNNVGLWNDPGNWYNDNSLDGRPGGSNEGWSGTTSGSGGWVRAKHVLPMSFKGTQVRFRIAFGSDGSGQFDGFAFDNFTIVDFNELDLGPKQSLCGTPNATLTPNIPITTGVLTWDNGDSTSTTRVVTAPGLYHAIFRDTLIDESTSAIVEVISSPGPDVNFRNDKDTVALNNYLTLDPQLPFNLNYSWSPAGATSPFYVFKGSDYGLGTHVISLTVTDSVLCTDQGTVEVHVVEAVGIEEGFASNLNIYPNPVSSSLTIEIENPQMERAEVRLFDLQGRNVYSNAFLINGNSRIEIEMSDLQEGSYLLQISDGEHTSVHKVVKTK